MPTIWSTDKQKQAEEIEDCIDDVANRYAQVFSASSANEAEHISDALQDSRQSSCPVFNHTDHGRKYMQEFRDACRELLDELHIPGATKGEGVRFAPIFIKDVSSGIEMNPRRMRKIETAQEELQHILATELIQLCVRK